MDVIKIEITGSPLIWQVVRARSDYINQHARPIDDVFIIYTSPLTQRMLNTYLGLVDYMDY